MPEHENLDQYIKLVQDALGKVGSDYYYVRVAGSDEEIYRERVFCYELYHQMRKKQETNSEFGLAINGEVDKRGHSVIRENFNPDFIIHKQGEMGNNHLVVEVKLTDAIEGVTKDFQTITCMVERYRYKYGLFILIGYDKRQLVERINGRLQSICHLSAHKNSIYILCKKNSNALTELFKLAEILEDEE